LNEGWLFLAALGLIGWAWHSSRTAHERVVTIARTVCHDLDVQLLDDTVALRRLRMYWRRHGFELIRTYRFEFSTDGARRDSGDVALNGLRLEWVRIEHPDGDYFVKIP